MGAVIHYIYMFSAILIVMSVYRRAVKVRVEYELAQDERFTRAGSSHE